MECTTLLDRSVRFECGVDVGAIPTPALDPEPNDIDDRRSHGQRHLIGCLVDTRDRTPDRGGLRSSIPVLADHRRHRLAQAVRAIIARFEQPDQPSRRPLVSESLSRATLSPGSWSS